MTQYDTQRLLAHAASQLDEARRHAAESEGQFQRDKEALAEALAHYRELNALIDDANAEIAAFTDEAVTQMSAPTFHLPVRRPLGVVTPAQLDAEDTPLHAATVAAVEGRTPLAEVYAAWKAAQADAETARDAWVATAHLPVKDRILARNDYLDARACVVEARRAWQTAREAVTA